MLPLIPLALSLAPEIGKWLFGATGESVVQSVVQAVQSITGTTDQAAAQQALAANPQAAAQLRVQLAQIAAQQEAAARQADLDTLRAQLGDIQSARAPLISAVVLVTFGLVMWAALTRALPTGSETILNMLLGTLAAMATSVVGYWVGSSAGSERKTDLLYHSTPAAAPQNTGAKP